MIVAAVSSFTIVIAIAITNTVNRNIVVVFGNVIFNLANVTQPDVAQSFGAIALKPIGIVR